VEEGGCEALAGARSSVLICPWTHGGYLPPLLVNFLQATWLYMQDEEALVNKTDIRPSPLVAGV
jgi:hypothetical protein